MAKRNTRSQADDGAVAQPAVKERRSRPRTGAAASAGNQATAQPTEAGAAIVDADPAPAISDTQAARPRVEDVRPPEDTIAADPQVLEATNLGENASASDQNSEPTDDEIRERAYHLYLERGGEHGRHEDDWHRAAEELRRNRK